VSWQCGGCGTWYAPFVLSCGCRKRGMSTVSPGLSTAEAVPAIANNGAATAALAGVGLDLEVQDPTPPSKARNRNFYTPEFEQFWEVYPSKRDKFAAAKAFEAAVKSGGAVPQILKAAAAYAADPHRDPAHTKYAQGWLNDRRWEDDLTPVAGPSVNPVWDAPAVGTPEFEERREAEERQAMDR
jgi:hypothetical protein